MPLLKFQPSYFRNILSENASQDEVTSANLCEDDSDNDDGDCNCDGDAECEHNEPGVLNKDICMLYAEKERNNKFGACALYVLVGPMLHAANVKITLVTIVVNQII